MQVQYGQIMQTLRLGCGVTFRWLSTVRLTLLGSHSAWFLAPPPPPPLIHRLLITRRETVWAS